MIENYRSGLVWKLFMSNPEIAPALEAIGFSPSESVRSHHQKASSPRASSSISAGRSICPS
jgi:hypothetical protein